MYAQTTNKLIMIRPAAFGYNAQTALSNAFQRNAKTKGIHEKALLEFDNMVQKMRANGIFVDLFQDTKNHTKPDAIFPNNWMSLHHDGTLVLYPMLAINRRLERRTDILERLGSSYSIKRIVDFTDSETEGRFLEGTGSIVFDHTNRIAYGCLSPRTNETLLAELCSVLNYRPVTFHAYDTTGKPIYHTNVLMAIGHKWVVCCLEAVESTERKMLEHHFLKNGLEIIPISIMQMEHFAGNLLEVFNSENKPYILLSQTAYDSLDETQKMKLESYAALLPFAIPTIEHIGGGSVRCMLAENFLPYATLS